MKPYSVSIINKRIAETISDDPLLNDISVIGEISNINYHYTGHVYFSIKDNSSTLKCIIFKSIADKLTQHFEDGMEVILNGDITVYQKGGSYSLNVKSIILSNDKGNLALEFEKMKEKLFKEGLFDEKYKKPLPVFPKNIGIVTSKTGAAIEDIKRIIINKNNYVNIYLFPVQVQGEGAGLSISSIIDKINLNHSYIDLLIVGRGGGSQEDLWAFNEEIVARSIFNSNIPIISAVGHEIDTSISDFVADVSCPTPTKAAELAVPDINELKDKINKYKMNLLIDLKSKLDYKQLQLNNIKNEMRDNINTRISNYEHKLELFKLSLNYNNPNTILNKGYSIIKDDKNITIKSIKDFIENDSYKLILKDGSVKFKPIDVKVGE